MTDTTTVAPVATTETKPVETKAKPQPKVLADKSAKPAKVVAKNQRQPMAADAVANRDIKFEGDKKATIGYTFKLSDKDDARYQVTTELDFSGVSKEQLMELAISSIRIMLQRNLRDMGLAALQQDVYTKVDVAKELLSKQRMSVDNFTKASRALQNLSPEEKKALMAQLAGA
jgi:hypothetical protein